MALLLLASCVRQPATALVPYDTIAIDSMAQEEAPTIHLPQKALAHPAFLEAGFMEETTTSVGKILYHSRSKSLGMLKVPTGKLLACDPIQMRPDADPLVYDFPKGAFPVELALLVDGNDTIVAMSRIRFSETAIAKWEVALHPGQEPLPVHSQAVYCYPVDAGLGVFVDQAAVIAFDALGESASMNLFMRLVDQPHYRGDIFAFGAYNLAEFCTGWGDGCYASYVGYDAAGNLCQLLTDFGVVAWWMMPKE